MTLRAVCRLEVAGRRVEAGATFEADADNAERLIRRRQAERMEAGPKPRAGKSPPQPE